MIPSHFSVTFVQYASKPLSQTCNFGDARLITAGKPYVV